MIPPDKRKPFVKGDPRAGRKPDPPELKFLKKQLSYSEMRTIMFKMLLMKPEELKNFKGNVLETSLASIVHRAIKDGDPTKIEFFFQRLFGKVPDKIELTEVDELKQLSHEQLIERTVLELEQFKNKLIGGSDE